MEFHERLREARLRAGLTQKEVADRVGIKADAGYRQYELGRSLPGIALATRMADALGVSLDWLAGRTDKIVVQQQKPQKIRHGAALGTCVCFDTIPEPFRNAKSNEGIGSFSIVKLHFKYTSALIVHDERGNCKGGIRL